MGGRRPTLAPPSPSFHAHGPQMGPNKGSSPAAGGEVAAWAQAPLTPNPSRPPPPYPLRGAAAPLLGSLREWPNKGGWLYLLNKFIYLILIHLINIKYILFNLSDIPEHFRIFPIQLRNPPNKLRINPEPFRFPLLTTSMIPNIPKLSPCIVEPLSVLPSGSGTLKTWLRHLSDQ